MWEEPSILPSFHHLSHTLSHKSQGRWQEWPLTWKQSPSPGQGGRPLGFPGKTSGGSRPLHRPRHPAPSAHLTPALRCLVRKAFLPHRRPAEGLWTLWLTVPASSVSVPPAPPALPTGGTLQTFAQCLRPGPGKHGGHSFLPRQAERPAQGDRGVPKLSGAVRALC